MRPGVDAHPETALRCPGMCTQSYFFSLIPTIIGLARELRDSDAREESAVQELRERIGEAATYLSHADGGIFHHGDEPLRLHVYEGRLQDAPRDADGRAPHSAVHLDAEDAARLTGGLCLLLTVCELPGAAPSGTVQDAVELLTAVTHAHARRCRDEVTRPDIPAPPPTDLYPGCTCAACLARRGGR